MFTQKKDSRVDRGFTLIEMIVAVAIFGVIASIVFPALIQFLDVRERVDEKHKQLVGLQKTFLFLAQDLRYASNRLGKDEFGDINKIDMTANYPDLNLAGLNVPRRVRWVLEDGVIQRIQSPVMDPDSDTRTIKQNLLSDVEEVEIELSVVEEGRDNTSKRWDEQTRLPDMVTVLVTMNSGVEYQRSFTMLGGDTLAAIAQANSQVGANGGASNPNNSNEPNGSNNSNLGDNADDNSPVDDAN